ncbi:ADAM protease ADM-B [Histoplasma capsulatum G186AR]|uniref:Disintegrin and metalloproteinase domain-containing protein B n=2 Tax=Ajellomyces capsulatus TaxID=5037 RepID=C0NJX6_AJECG|nr:ADAM protease ADM-B [Histoplasma capsulatum G186AR]EEH08167.1 ADAM protease ADM-B [Histoplasma capsulatum G186AR]
MRFFRGLVPLITSALSIFTSNVDAHSERRSNIGYLSLVEQPTIHTPSHRVNALSHFDITFELHKRRQRLKLSLEPNHDILPDDAQVHFLDQAGNIQKSEFIKRQDHKVFKGWSWIQVAEGNWERAGWARVVVKKDWLNPLFEGTFTVNHDHHHVLLRSSYAKSKHELDKDVEDTTGEYMIVFRDSDMELIEDDDRPILAELIICCFNSDPDHPVFRRTAERDTTRWGSMSLESVFGLSRRQLDMPGGGNAGGVNLATTIGSTAGCPSRRKVALIGVATDCSYAQTFDSQPQLTRENVISVVNSASQVYEETFNVSLGLRNLIVSPAACPASPVASAPWNVGCGGAGDALTLGQRLNLFSAWRGKQKDDNAFWTLMSNCRTGAEVGLAWLGQLCNRDVRGNPNPNNSSSQAVTGANVVARTPNEWQVFAHEVGHTFGAVHDCDASLCNQQAAATSQCCPFSRGSCNANGRFIMNPTSGRGITQFSPCTVGNICSGMGRNSVRSDCLVNNRGVVTITGSQCGNGIVEEGEDCDCGGEASCRGNPCCDAQTCKFKDNAVCDDSNEECCENCQYKSSDSVCRASTGPCDPEEKCTGKSPNCPPDKNKPDGESCGNGLACASGQCTSRDRQCQTLMGSLLGGNDTYSCDDRTCTLTCSSPSLPPNTCSSLNQNFLDGTPCTAGGRCKNGVCEGSSFGKEVKSWIDNNRSLVIGLAAGIGGLLLLSILSCIVKRCRTRRPPKSMAPMTQGAVFSPPPPGLSGWRGQRPADPFISYPPQQGYGPGGPIDPPFPPPAYGSTAAARGRMPSVRYA